MTAVVEKFFYVCFLVNLNFISVAEFDDSMSESWYIFRGGDTQLW